MTSGLVGEPLVDLAQIAEIELFIAKRMKEVMLGDHTGVFRGPGPDFVGLRDWQPGDRASAIDWAHSSLNNFSPLAVREFEQPSTAAIVAIADASLSTRCGSGGAFIAAAIARTVAAVGLSAVFFQDLFGLLTFDNGFRQLEVVRPQVGKSHVLHCLDRYQVAASRDMPAPAGRFEETIAAYLRRPTLIPVISDFLFADVERLISELSRLDAIHDVLLVMVDVRFAYDLPRIGAGWIEIFDVETGSTRLLSKREFRQLTVRIEEWQERVRALAREYDLDIVQVGLDRSEMETALIDLVAERRLRKAR